MTILPADLRAENAEAPWTDEKVAKIINTSVKRIDDLAAENATLRATLARYQTAEAVALVEACKRYGGFHDLHLQERRATLSMSLATPPKPFKEGESR